MTSNRRFRSCFQFHAAILVGVILVAGCAEEKRQWPLLESSVSFKIDVFPVGEEGKVEVRVESSDPRLWSVTQGADPLVPKSRVLSVYRSEKMPNGRFVVSPSEMPQVGSFRVEGPYLYFSPEYAPRPDEPWVVEFRPALLHPQLYAPEINPPIYKRFGGDQPTIQRPEVLAVFPSGYTPANAINVTIIFSEPMKKGDELNYISLIDTETGVEVKDPFLPNFYWENTRLCLQFDTNRQVNAERDVEPGVRRKGPKPVLEADKRYAIKIFGDWESEEGIPISNFGEDFYFDTGPVDKTPPNLERWVIHDPPPRPGTNDGLVIGFNDTYSYRTLLNTIAIRKADGTVVQPYFAFPLDDATGWQMQPKGLWEAGEYEIVVSNMLEDRAGNSVDGPLELDEDGLPKVKEPRTVTRKFTIGPIE